MVLHARCKDAYVKDRLKTSSFTHGLHVDDNTSMSMFA